MTWQLPFQQREAILKRIASIDKTPSLGWFDIQVLAFSLLLRFAR
jgi:hypothetical protein